jgi:hypothetical protein
MDDKYLHPNQDEEKKDLPSGFEVEIDSLKTDPEASSNKSFGA